MRLPFALEGQHGLGDLGHGERIEDAGQEGEGDEQGRRGTKFGEHRGCSLGEAEGDDREIDELDADEGHQDAAEAVDEEIAGEHRAGFLGAVLDAAQGERDQRDDDQRVEDDRREDRALRRVEAHYIEHAEFRNGRDEQRRDDGEILRDVVGDREGGQRAARHQELLPDAHDLDELGGIAVEIDHVAGLAGGLRAALHGNADIRLRERGCVIGAVAAHGDETALALFVADIGQLVLRRGLGDEIVDAGLRRDRRRRDGVVAGDHHRADAHAAQLREPLLDVRLHDVLQMDDADDPSALGEAERRSARARDALDGGVEGRDFGRRPAAGAGHEAANCVDGALADLAIADIRAGKTRRRRERNEVRARLRLFRDGDAIALAGEGEDGAALRGLIGEACFDGEPRGFLLGDAGNRDDLGRHAIAEGDRAGLIEQQRVDVAGRLDGPAGHGEHIVADQTVHAGDADGRKQAADRRRDQRDEQRDQDRHGHVGARIASEPGERHDGDQEDQRHADEEDRKRDLVRRLLPLGALDERDHAVEERRAGAGGDAHHDPVRDDGGAAGDGGAVAARFADDRRRFAGDRGLVDRGYAGRDLAVAGDKVAGLDIDEVTDLEVERGDAIEMGMIRGIAEALCHRIRARLA